MEGDSSVSQVKQACSNEGRWEGDEYFGWGILSDVGCDLQTLAKYRLVPNLRIRERPLLLRIFAF